MKTDVQNVKEMRDELLEVFNGLRNRTIKAREAKEINNTAGKIIATCKQQLEYNKNMAYSRRIGFLEVDSEEVKTE